MSRLTPGFVALRDVGNGNDAGMRFKSLSKTPYTQARHLLRLQGLTPLLVPFPEGMRKSKKLKSMLMQSRKAEA